MSAKNAFATAGPVHGTPSSPTMLGIGAAPVIISTLIWGTSDMRSSSYWWKFDCCTTPFTSDEVDLYNQALAGAAASLVFTNGGYSTTFSFAALQFPDRSPVVPGKTEIPLELHGTARKSGSTSELVVTHDSTA